MRPALFYNAGDKLAVVATIVFFWGGADERKDADIKATVLLSWPRKGQH